MKKRLYSFKISQEIRDLVINFCDKRGIEIDGFVEQAIKEKIYIEEKKEDSLEFKKWRHEANDAIDYRGLRG